MLRPLQAQRAEQGVLAPRDGAAEREVRPAQPHRHHDENVRDDVAVEEHRLGDVLDHVGRDLAGLLLGLERLGLSGRLGLERLLQGDLVVVDLDERGPLKEEWLRSRAGWSPFVGRELNGWPVLTALAGRVAYKDHALVGEPAGKPLRYL